MEEIPISGRFSLAGFRRFQLRARVGPAGHQRDGPPLTDPSIEISRGGFLRRVTSLLKARATNPKLQPRVAAEQGVVVLPRQPRPARSAIEPLVEFAGSRWNCPRMSARPGLCGGHRATGVPIAIASHPSSVSDIDHSSSSNCAIVPINEGPQALPAVRCSILCRAKAGSW